jgi:prolyl oligopeptidase
MASIDLSTQFSSQCDTDITTDSVSDVYHGVEVADPYRWLEQAEHPKVVAWSESQNQKTREFLDALPERKCIYAQLSSLFEGGCPSYSGFASRPGLFFALKTQPPLQQSLLVVIASLDDLDSEKTVLDPNRLHPLGMVAIDWFVPSPDGEVVAVCLSACGSEEGNLHFYRTRTGEALADCIERVQRPTGGGSAAWAPDGKSIFYTRYPRVGERLQSDLDFYQQIYLHQIGTEEADDFYSAGADFPRIALIQLEISRNGRWLLACVANGDGGEYAHYVLDAEMGDLTAWRQFTRFEDGIKDVALGCDGETLFLNFPNDGTKVRILSLPLDGPLRLADAEVVVIENGAVMEGFVVTPSHLYLSEVLSGWSRISNFELAGGEQRPLPLVEGKGVADLIALAEWADDERILFRQTSFTEPDTWWVYHPEASEGAGYLRQIALGHDLEEDLVELEVRREYSVSKDGSRIPLNIVMRKGARRDGNNPTLLTGYGGYGHIMRPRYDRSLKLWFDRGGIFALANLRGGGEFGKQWHLGGNLTRKQNVFDDFEACARHLIEHGYTRSSKLAVEGRSNGGLLMGAFLTQRPELARAVVAHVGMYDMLRVELDPNGAFNVPEFGTVKIADQFHALHAYSPYHQVVDGTAYPAVLLLTGERDGRVNPAHSRKMAARLQAAQRSGNPILLRLSADSGHGMGTSHVERISATADVFAFLYHALGMTE